MSRVYEGDGENPACTLWGAWFKRAVDCKRGQTFLRELEASILALPERRLSMDAFAGASETPNGPVPTGEVCALGALALARRLKAGEPRDAALRQIVERMPYEDDGSSVAADELKMARTLAWEIIQQNDDVCCSMTPETRYEHMLAYVRSLIHATA